jgi:chromate transporter
MKARPMGEIETHRRRLTELAALFLKLDTIGFGGPAAHLAMMEDEVVERRGWRSLGSASSICAAPPT